MIRFLLCASALASTLTLAACGQNTAPETGAPEASPAPAASQAMVAAANPLAVEAGLEALRAGGDAVDAAIAVQSVLGLVEPQSSGLGGGAFMLYFDAETGTTTVYDGRETAPASASPELFLDESGAPLSFFDAVFSGHSVGAPGAIAMLAMAHEDHGLRPWSDGFSAAIELAEDGFDVSPRMHNSIAAVVGRTPLDQWAAPRDYFFLPDGSPLPVGYHLTNEAYATSARAIADDWHNLYSGPLAEAIIAAVQAEPRPGGLTTSDLAGYQAIRRDALCRPYREWTVCGAPPPASGGVSVNEILGLLEPYDMAATGPESVEGWRRFIEASRLAYADRDAYVADPAFVDVPVEGLLDSGYVTNRAAAVQGNIATPHVIAGTPPGIAAPGMDATPDSPGTSHFVIVDSDGDVISMTTTVESIFGSHRMAGGFLLNNQLTDFSRIPVDAEGRAIPNAPDAGKRPRSSMSPTIVFDANGDFVLATGSPGGSSIIAYTAKSLIGILDWGLTPQEAVNLPNVVANGDIIRIEDGMDPVILTGLQNLGFTLDANRGENSGIHIVQRLADGTLIGGADPRREGVALQP